MAKFNHRLRVIEAEQWQAQLPKGVYHYEPMPPVHSALLREKRSFWDWLLRRPVHWYVKTPGGEKEIKPGDWVIEVDNFEVIVMDDKSFRCLYWKP